VGNNTKTPVFAAIGVVLFCVVLVFVLVLPKIGQVSSAKDDLAVAQAQQQTLESQKAALEDLQAKAPENRALIDQVEKRIPPTADESGLLLLLHNAVIDSGLDLATITPTPPALNTTGDLSVIVVSVQATGTYNEITQFVFAIETLPRAAQITSLALSPTSEAATSGQPELSAAIQLNAYTTDTSAGPGSTPGPTEGTG
jgi:Tfp pilus assembly protein PilO